MLRAAILMICALPLSLDPRPSTASAASPADDVRVALANVRSLPADARYQARYASFYHLPDDEHADCVAALNVALNAVSRNRIIAQVSPIEGASVARIDLLRYTDPKDERTYDEFVRLWDRVAEQDPYFNLRTEVLRQEAGGRRPEGARSKRPSSLQPPASSLKTVTVVPGWTGAAHGALNAETGTNGTLQPPASSLKPPRYGAIVRADYLIAAISSTTRVPGAGYYQWAGIPETLDELLKDLGVDRKLLAEEAADSAANVFVSRVTHRARRVLIMPTIHGHLYLTKDTVRDGPERSPVRNPVDVGRREARGGRLEAGGRRAQDGFFPPGSSLQPPASRLRPFDQKFVFDAQEAYFHKSNRWWGNVLYDAAGKRQDIAPFTDDTARAKEALQPMVSCYRCHEAKGQAGLQDFEDVQHTLPINPNYFPDVAQRIRELYYDQGRVQLELRRDREDFSIAVQTGTGLQPSAAVGALARIYGDFVYEDIDVETAARECGASVARFRAAAARSKDPYVFALSQDQVKVTRGDWEDSFAEAMLQVGQVPEILGPAERD